MKYITKFEKKLFDTNDYDVDDYIKYRQTNYTFSAKIIKKDGPIYLVQNKSNMVTIVKEQILRLLNDEEIEELILSLNTKKFNL